MAEEQQRHQEVTSMPQAQQKPSSKDRTSIHELRNQDYVSRLLAATPPYLYSAPVGPNNFFFSDMLRSLVQARNNENARNLQLQQAAIMARRPRKRAWSQHRPYYEHLRERKNLDEKNSVTEKPLELTNKPFLPMASTTKYPKSDSNSKDSFCNHKVSNDSNSTENQTLQENVETVSLPPNDLVLPPPPPVWYPPIYPPYGIDPLHFFIDLRVSGHIYDRKKENVSPLANAETNALVTTGSNSPGKQRHGSAFTIPVPRSESKGSSAMNLSSTSSSADEQTDKTENYPKYYDGLDTKENHPGPKGTANYVLQNLPRLYNQFNCAKDHLEEISYPNGNKSDPECEDSIDEQACEVFRDNSAHIDVEIIESTKFSNNGGGSGGGGGGSMCATPNDCDVTHQSD